MGVKVAVPLLPLPVLLIPSDTGLADGLIPTKEEGSDTTNVVPGGNEMGRFNGRGKVKGNVTGKGNVKVTVAAEPCVEVVTVVAGVICVSGGTTAAVSVLTATLGSLNSVHAETDDADGSTFKGEETGRSLQEFELFSSDDSETKSAACSWVDLTKQFIRSSDCSDSCCNGCGIIDCEEFECTLDSVANGCLGDTSSRMSCSNSSTSVTCSLCSNSSSDELSWTNLPTSADPSRDSSLVGNVSSSSSSSATSSSSKADVGSSVSDETKEDNLFTASKESTSFESSACIPPSVHWFWSSASISMLLQSSIFHASSSIWSELLGSSSSLSSTDEESSCSPFERWSGDGFEHLMSHGGTDPSEIVEFSQGPESSGRIISDNDGSAAFGLQQMSSSEVSSFSVWTLSGFSHATDSIAAIMSSVTTKVSSTTSTASSMLCSTINLSQDIKAASGWKEESTASGWVILQSSSGSFWSGKMKIRSSAASFSTISVFRIAADISFLVFIVFFRLTRLRPSRRILPGPFCFLDVPASKDEDPSWSSSLRIEGNDASFRFTGAGLHLVTPLRVADGSFACEWLLLFPLQPQKGSKCFIFHGSNFTRSRSASALIFCWNSGVNSPDASLSLHFWQARLKNSLLSTVPLIRTLPSLPDWILSTSGSSWISLCW